MSAEDLKDRSFPTQDGASPMMAQFLTLREEAPRDALLFYRMGDFYELFFDDAQRAAAALDIALTKRGEHQGEPIPMCGVPAATAEAYLARLIRAGFKVAIGEQTEDPKEAKKRGSKSVVERQIVRVVTPGTLTEDTLLEARSANRIAALCLTAAGDCALAWAEVSTGEFAAAPSSVATLAADLAAIDPVEILVEDTRYAEAGLLGSRARITGLATAKYDRASGERRLKARFGVQALDAFGDFTGAEVSALGALLDYLELAQAGSPARLAPPKRQAAQSVMAIDPATRASLEIERTLQGHRKGSLLDAVDRTVTAPGARLLASRIGRPSTDRAEIEARLDAVAVLHGDRAQRETIRLRLKAAGDPERALTRLLLGRGGPRDLAALACALREGEVLAAELSQRPTDLLPSRLADAATALDLTPRQDLARLVADLETALSEEPCLMARDGGFIAPGWDGALDEARALRDESRKVIAGLQAQYAEASGISSLKVKHNNVLGYFVEVNAKHGERLIGTEPFIHRQTMANAVRFSTTELSEIEARIAGAAERALGLELEHFERFRGRVEAEADAIRTAAQALASLDVAAGLAEWAEDCGATRPVLSDTPVFRVEGGRHPVVEAALKKAGDGPFTPNDCTLDGGGTDGPRLTFVTGPNMAGKSTYLRQNALILVLAQAGSFVPAAKAEIGLADRLYSRVGAADDLARGRSTFMAEMIEAAAILNQATAHSFVILDEIGRGTATFDGLSIAWATAEHLHAVNKCRALFATHYHELTRLADDLEAAGNVSLKAKEWKGELVFLHTVAPGAADRSYGIEVARRAGYPPAALGRAKTILERLESENHQAARLEDLPLFTAAPAPAPAKPSEVEARLKAVDADNLTPREALDVIYALKALAEKS